MLTLLQMANSIVGKLGQYDSTSLALCKGFLGLRYQTVWDSYFWNDSQDIEVVTIGAGVNVFPTPANLERVTTIGNETGLFLDPVDQGFLIEADPSVLTSTGTPEYYSPTPDGEITVFPTPGQPTELRLFGKMPCPGFATDSTKSVLRNCDNAIMAFATGDMLERQRQYQKAQAKFQEAAALLEEAKSVERDQANRPRKNKTLTVSGNSLAEMTDAVCGICGQWTPDIRILVREFLRRNYVSLYQLQLWPESTVVVRIAFYGEQIVLPHFVARVLAVRSAEGFRLMPDDVSYLFAVSPNIFETFGTPMNVSILTPVGVGILPPAPPEALTIAIADPTDGGKRIFIRGESGGTELTENLVLNAGGLVTGNAYDVPITVAKDLTNGTVSIYGATTTNLYEQLQPDERERKHQRIWITPPPQTSGPTTDCTTGCMVLGKRQITPLKTDEDTPIITGAQTVLIAGAAADLYRRLGNMQMAAEFSAKADAASKVLVSENVDQSAYSPKFVPAIEPYAYPGFWGGYCWTKQ